MKKSLLVSLAAVMIFGLMGLGFAMWSDTVSVAATVETGTVDIGIRDAGTNDNVLTDDILNGTATNTDDGFADAMALGGDPQIAPGLNSEGKNVATFTSTNGDGTLGSSEFEIGGNGYYSSITEALDNVYPYYAPTTRFQIASNGSIPVKLDKVNIEGNIPGLVYESWKVTYPDGTIATGTGLDGLLDALYNLQLHKDNVVTVELQVSFDQDHTVQGSSGELTFTVHAAQWNEAGQNDPKDDLTGNMF